MNYIQRVQSNFADSIRLKSEQCDHLAPLIASAAEIMIIALRHGRKILSCGNGGSAADAQHFSAEMLNRLQSDCTGLPAIALTTDSSTLTAIANDYQFADVFSKQIHALGQPGDILLAITTSGESNNIIHAINAAHDQGMRIIVLTGRAGGRVVYFIDKSDIEIRVPSPSTPRVQEVHIMIIHSLCDLINLALAK